MENNNPKVLIIDDDTEFVRKLSEKLEEVRLTPVIAVTGKEALDYISKNDDISFIILDFIMPGMDGYTFDHVLRHDMRKNIPTVVLTNFPETKKTPQDLEVYVKNETNLDDFAKKIKERLIIQNG